MITGNVKSYKKVNKKAQMPNFSVSSGLDFIVDVPNLFYVVSVTMVPSVMVMR